MRPIRIDVYKRQLLYYFFDGIRQNASALAEVVDKKGQSTTKLNVTMGQLLDNKEMFIVMAIFVITTPVSYTHLAQPRRDKDS